MAMLEERFPLLYCNCLIHPLSKDKILMTWCWVDGWAITDFCFPGLRVLWQLNILKPPTLLIVNSFLKSLQYNKQQYLGSRALMFLLVIVLNALLISQSHWWMASTKPSDGGGEGEPISGLSCCIPIDSALYYLLPRKSTSSVSLGTTLGDSIWKMSLWLMPLIGTNLIFSPHCFCLS